MKLQRRVVGWPWRALSKIELKVAFRLQRSPSSNWVAAEISPDLSSAISSTAWNASMTSMETSGAQQSVIAGMLGSRRLVAKEARRSWRDGERDVNFSTGSRDDSLRRLSRWGAKCGRDCRKFFQRICWMRGRVEDVCWESGIVKGPGLPAQGACQSCQGTITRSGAMGKRSRSLKERPFIDPERLSSILRKGKKFVHGSRFWPGQEWFLQWRQSG